MIPAPGAWSDGHAARGEFRILGPLEVVSGGQPLTLGGPKQRALLATLLLNPNRVVSMDQLIDVLWEGVPCESATVQVQSHISALRRVLRAGQIITRPPGYLLQVEAGQLDLVVFEEQVSLARQALRAGDMDAAAESFRAALDLWRGDALSDVMATWVRVAATRLDDLRLAVFEERIDAYLALGRHAEIAAELSALVARYPFREQLRLQLMIALYRSGRRAEALHMSRETRRLFVEELGLDQSRTLAELERAMLVGDASLEVGPSRQAMHLRVPRQLPTDIADFTGREAQVRLLRGWTVAGNRSGNGHARPVPVSMVAGPGGVGKTVLAVHTAHQISHHFPDGQLYASLGGGQARPVEPGEVLGSFLSALGMEPQAIPCEVQAREALFRTLLAGRRILVVLDDAAGSGQVRPLLPGGPSCAVLVTSRAPLGDLEGSRCLELDLFDREEALALFAAIAGEWRVEAELEAAREVVRACGYLPLAVRIAASRLATRSGWTVRVLADLIADAHSRLDALQYGELGVRSSFEVSYRTLDRHAGRQGAPGRAFRLLGLLDARDISLGSAAAVLDVPAAQAEQALELLVDTRLLDSPGRGRYRYLDLMRLFARELAEAEPDAEQDAALDRALRFALASIERADLLVRPGRLVPYTYSYRGPAELPSLDYQGAVAWLENEHANLLALAFQAAAGRGGRPSEPPAVPSVRIACLVAHLSGFLEVQGLWTEWEQVASAALKAARRDGDRYAESLAGHELGLVAYRRGRLDEATERLCQCLELYREVADSRGEARALNNLGGIANRRGMPREATIHYQAALAVCRKGGIRDGECGILGNLGLMEQLQGRLGSALTLYQESLSIQRETANRDGEANVLNNLGCVHRELGSYAEAAACQEQALRICRESGNRYWEAITLVDLAVTCRDAGRADIASTHAEAAVAACRGMGDQLGQASALRALGDAASDLGDRCRARACWLEALGLLERLDSPLASEVRSLLSQVEGGAGAR